MPEHIKALIVVLFLAGSVFFFLSKPAVAILGRERFKTRRNLWLGITMLAFLTHNFWLYILTAWFLLSVGAARDKLKISLFLFLIFALTFARMSIPGFGIVNYLFDLNHPRFLVICLLIPVFLQLIRGNERQGGQFSLVDILVILYVLLTVVLQFRGTTVTDSLRFAFYQFIDVYLPYFIASRTLTTSNSFKDAMFSYVAAVMILSIIGVFEFVKHWHLYSGVESALGLPSSTSYLSRAGYLRAQASLERIPLGFVIAVGIGFYIYLRRYYPSKMNWYLGLGLLIGGLISPLSRGPWVGALVLVLVFLFFSRNKFRNLTQISVIAGILALAISFTPYGAKFVGLIPFVGDIETGNITYRQQLIESSWVLIQREPWLGVNDYLNTPEMQALMTGEGIIDTVNTYISVTLKYGLVGLTLFAGAFILACWNVFICFAATRLLDEDEKVLGHTLLAVLMSIMVMIFTVSSVSAIPLVYWIVLGMCSGYIRMIRKKRLQTSSYTGTIQSSGGESSNHAQIRNAY